MFSADASCCSSRSNVLMPRSSASFPSAFRCPSSHSRRASCSYHLVSPAMSLYSVSKTLPNRSSCGRISHRRSYLRDDEGSAALKQEMCAAYRYDSSEGMKAHGAAADRAEIPRYRCCQSPPFFLFLLLAAHQMWLGRPGVRPSTCSDSPPAAAAAASPSAQHHAPVMLLMSSSNCACSAALSKPPNEAPPGGRELKLRIVVGGTLPRTRRKSMSVSPRPMRSLTGVAELAAAGLGAATTGGEGSPAPAGRTACCAAWAETAPADQ